MPKIVLQEEVDKLKDFQLYPDDVWVVTYPKCGTTWTQHIVRLIRNNGEPDGVKLSLAVPWLERIRADFHVDQVKRPRAFKSHFPYDLLPCGPPHTTPCKYIYVMRNPKDVAVSLYFHTRSLHFPDIEWGLFWKKFVDREMEFGDYFESWLPHKNDPNIMFLKYEDMKKDLRQAVCQIAEFIGSSLSEEVITKIVELTTFEKMKNDNTANYSWDKAHQKQPFLRKGIVGDWKNFLTPEQSAEIDAICSERLKGTGLTFEYD